MRGWELFVDRPIARFFEHIFKVKLMITNVCAPPMLVGTLNISEIMKGWESFGGPTVIARLANTFLR